MNENCVPEFDQDGKKSPVGPPTIVRWDHVPAASRCAIEMLTSPPSDCPPVSTRIDRESRDQLGLVLATSQPPSAGMTFMSVRPSGLMTQLDVVEFGSLSG